MHGLENLIRKHLGLAASESESPRPFTASPPRDAEHCLTFYIPSGNGLQELDVGELERELTEAVGASKAGEWAGHGTDLEMGIFDMRFVGKSTARMLDAIRPVLRRWRHSLPAGWHLTDHTDYTDPQRLTLNLE